MDGHTPGVTGYKLNAYVAAGICSDHECCSLENALRKLKLGQHIMIREGTAARNLEALLPMLAPQYVDQCMFCCNDKHTSDLLEKGCIDCLVKHAIQAALWRGRRAVVPHRLCWPLLAS